MSIRQLLLTTTFVGVGLAIVFAASSGRRPTPTPAPGPGEPTLAEVRHATERFRDVKVALAEGDIRDPVDVCETHDNPNGTSTPLNPAVTCANHRVPNTHLSSHDSQTQ